MTENGEKESQKESEVDGEENIKSGIIQLKKSDHIFLFFTTARGFGECQLMLLYSFFL